MDIKQNIREILIAAGYSVSDNGKVAIAEYPEFNFERFIDILDILKLLEDNFGITISNDMLSGMKKCQSNLENLEQLVTVAQEKPELSTPLLSTE